MIESPSFVDVLRLRAGQSPDRIALRFLDSGEVSGTATYAELDRSARTIAAHLTASGRPGQRAVLLFPPGPDYVTAFFGCLYAGIIAVPAYPPTDPRQLPRLLALIQDAEPDFVLTIDAYREMGQAMLAAAMGPDGADPGRGPRWVATDGLDPAGARAWVPPAAGPDTTAFLQYTSGTTGQPKGVVVSHGNLLTNSALIHRRFGHDADSSGVIWLPPYHDMGLIGGILQPIYGGFPVALMSPLDLLRDPFLWLRAVSEFGATTSGGPNFAYDLCVRKVRPEQRETLDLSGWRVAFTGAEPVRAATLRRFAETFAPNGFRSSAFYPCYGLAEATLMVTGGLPDREPVVAAFEDAALGAGNAVPARAHGRELVGCGVVADGHDLAIADPETGTPLADGTVGEIWVRGPGVAHGYWGRGGWPADVAGRLAGDAGEPFLRTGDLGFRRDGELFVCGRRKDVIIVRGRNHSPDDIELAACAADPRLRPGCGAAFTVDGPDEPRLVVAYEVAATELSTVEATELAGAVRAAVLAAHGLAVHTVALLPKGALPKTSSGKIRRSGCRTELLEGRLPLLGVDALPERPDLAAGSGARHVEAVRATVAEILGIGVDAVAPDRPLAGLGLDS
ncbi:MAG TPA: AMP-binding protein, partial [Rugosimonospora sp.]|nr:AMP-binding protein [Rugosimonospora sp.]